MDYCQVAIDWDEFEKRIQNCIDYYFEKQNEKSQKEADLLLNQILETESEPEPEPEEGKLIEVLF